MKQCIRCGVSKDDSEFALNRHGSKIYRRNVCRVCYDASRPNHENDPQPEGLTCNRCHHFKAASEFPKQRQCLYGLDPVCKACKLELRRVRKARFPDGERRIRLKMHYGLTLEQYGQMVEQQHGKCAICGTSEEKLVVDHNHTTGQVRGLLCHLCNAMIGCARENIDILTRATAYLYAEAHPDTGPVRAQIAFVGASAL